VASLPGFSSTPGRTFAASVGQGIRLVGLTTAGLAWVPAAVAGVTATGFTHSPGRPPPGLPEGDCRTELVGEFSCRHWR
jgi:hypothetical protein